MLTEIQFKGLYTGRLSYVDHPEISGYQLFGVVILHFKNELYAEQRVRIISLLKQAKKDGQAFSFILQFNDNVEFSSVDMNMFKEIYNLSLEWGSQFQIICGSASMQSINSFSRTAGINVFNSLNEALLNCKDKFFSSFGNKLTRNIFVMESDPQQRLSLVNALLIDRFSAVEVSSSELALSFVKHFGKVLDGAILEFVYPEFKEVEILHAIKSIHPDSKILIHTPVLDPRILSICQEYKVTSVIKSPYKIQNLLKKYRGEFPERDENYLGFSG